MKKTLLAVALAQVCLPSMVYADTSTDEVMVVTANRFEQSVKNVIAPVSIVTKDEIDAIQAKSLAEVLRRLPGVQIANQGGAGQNAELYVRGTSSKHVLVLMNGVRIGSATTGYANFSAIPLSGVEQIEFIRGPRAAVYGSDAVGGVINIITTYRGDDSRRVEVGGGSDGYYRASASIAGEVSDSSWGKISITHEESDGYNIQKGSSNPLDVDDDGYRNSYVVADFGTALDDKWQLSANGYYQDAYTEYDNPFVGSDKTNSDLYNISGRVNFTDEKLYSEFVVSANQDKATTSGQGTAESTIKTNRTSLNWNNYYQVNDEISIGGGLDYYNDKVDNTSTQYVKDERYNRAAYLLADYTTEVAQVEANIRYDDNESFGSYTTWQVGAGWRFTEALRLTGMMGTAFKSPTFNELYWPDQGFWKGNPNLQPEESKNYEVAVEGNHSLVNWRLALYQNEITDFITSPVGGNMPENIGEVDIKGVELAMQFETGPIYHDVSFDYLDPENKTDDKQLQRRSKQSSKWNATYYLEQWQFDMSYLYQGKRYDDKANTTELDAYSLLDLSATYFFNDKLSVVGKVANVLDEDYETAKGYSTPERSYYATLTYQF